MTRSHEDSTDQQETWRGAAGQGWVAAESLLDQVFQPFEDLLVDAARAASARRVLDIGCGTGATTLAVARRLGAACTGIDVSPPMIAAARARAIREGVAVNFVSADAETHRFEPRSFDCYLSRFGVMFFADPVRAFANLLAAATPAASLACIAWRSPAENPFMTAAERAAEPLLPGVSRREPDRPGQFGFARRELVEDILTRSGWRDVAVTPIDVPCAFPVSALDWYLENLGPVGRALQTVAPAERPPLTQVIRPAFDPYLQGDDVRFVAACWMIEGGS